MRNLPTLLATVTLLVLGGVTLQAQLPSIGAMTSFGGDGWLAPGEGGITWLTTGNGERSLAYGNGQIYLAYGGNAIKRVDATIGTALGDLTMTGVTGGARVLNVVGVAGDGAIYGANLNTATSVGSPFKVYRWADNVSVSTVHYSGTLLTGARMGDDFDVTGSGAGTRIATGFGTTPAIAGNNGYGVVDGSGGGTVVGFTGTPPAAGDFRLGLTFTDDSHLIGTQGGSGSTTTTRYTSFSGATGTLIGSPSLAGSIAQRPMDFAVINGMPVLATISSGDSTVRIFDMTDPLAPLLLLSRNNTFGALTNNVNGTGSVAWGLINGSDATLYAMSSNQGIQAFMVVIPEPTSLSLLGLGLAAMWLGRRRS